jgi:nicotinamidase-related amidase
MSREAVSNVSYPVAPGTTVLLTIDCQFGFGAGSWEQVPHADAAVENLRRASRAWRSCGGTVVHVQTVYTPERASQAIGTLPAEAAHEAAISRMAYLFAAVQDTDAFVAQVRALQPAAG